MVVRRGEIVSLGGLRLEGHGLSVASETLGLSSRVRRAAPSLQTQSEKPLVDSHGLAKTATLTMLLYRYVATKTWMLRMICSTSSPCSSVCPGTHAAAGMCGSTICGTQEERRGGTRMRTSREGQEHLKGGAEAAARDGRGGSTCSPKRCAARLRISA